VVLSITCSAFLRKHAMALVGAAIAIKMGGLRDVNVDP